MMETYYKVVRKNRKGSLVSAIATGAGEIRYAPYEWTSARKSLASIDQDICVFGEYDDARDFACEIFYEGACIQIWACECEGLHDPTVFIRAAHFDYFTKMKEIVEIIRNRRGEITSSLWPEGTMMAKRIHLKGLLVEYK